MKTSANLIRNFNLYTASELEGLTNTPCFIYSAQSALNQYFYTDW